MATIGTPEYSQALAGYLNNLSPDELIGLGGDFNVAGLARSDLSSVDPFGGNRQFRPGGYLKSDLAYSPEELNVLSKYRNLEGMRGDEYGQSTMKAVGFGDMAGDRKRQEMIDLWGTRNAPGTDEPLFRYSGDGFERLPYRPSDDGFLEQFLGTYLAPIVVGGLGAGLLGLGASGATAGAGAAEGLSSNFSLLGGTGAEGLGVTAPTAGGVGSSASLISGPGSLGLTAGGSAGNALALSPSFSLLNGAGSLGFDLASRWALPENLKSIDYSAPYKDLAKKGAKKLLGGGQEPPQYQRSGPLLGGSMTQPRERDTDTGLVPFPFLNFVGR